MPPAPLNPIWCANEAASATDSYVAFRASFEIASAGTVTFRVLGATWFNLWLDGAWFNEGPARFPKTHPEYQTFTADLAAGRHTLAFLVNHIGVPTRLLDLTAPFIACHAEQSSQPIELLWKCTRFDAYVSGVRRINPQLGFIEWCDTRQLSETWNAVAFDDSPWPTPVPASPEIGAPQPLTIANPRAIIHAPQLLASGDLVETFGYERDDVPARFFLRDLAPTELPPQGIWRRYDLGRVRLMRPRFIINAPAGAVIEFAYSESLVRGRVSPWITLSTGNSCNLDHYVARGGPQEFFPITPRSGRFLEVHVLAPPNAVEFVREEIMERAYYGDASGKLHTDDALLDRIWSVGIETHRACTEDAITDNPTRERGQWTGDVVTVGMDIAAAAFGDLRLCRRSLVQCALCARDDGMVAGLCPGGTAFLTTYAAQWINACVHYWELTGDRALLEEMLPFAERNLAAFAAKWTPGGLQDDLGWGFVDWGYVRNPGTSDMGVNLHYYAALQGMVRWSTELSRDDLAAKYREAAQTVHPVIARYYADEFAAGSDVWKRIGYHRTALGLRLRFFDAVQSNAGRAFLREHMLNCFPNRHDAPRLSDPYANNPQLITPYFGHFALPELIRHGGMDFVLDQYRTCWGWALGGGRTTWVEVFDTRWTHCHQWAGCPTWQLSRWLLGLSSRFDLGVMHYDFELCTGSLPEASGAVPIAGREDAITISWTKSAGLLHYTLQTPVALILHLPAKLGGGTVSIEREFTASWPVQACT